MAVPTQPTGALYCVFSTAAMSSAWLSQKCLAVTVSEQKRQSTVPTAL